MLFEERGFYLSAEDTVSIFQVLPSGHDEGEINKKKKKNDYGYEEEKYEWIFEIQIYWKMLRNVSMKNSWQFIKGINILKKMWSEERKKNLKENVFFKILVDQAKMLFFSHFTISTHLCIEPKMSKKEKIKKQQKCFDWEKTKKILPEEIKISYHSFFSSSFL